MKTEELSLASCSHRLRWKELPFNWVGHIAIGKWLMHNYSGFLTSKWQLVGCGHELCHWPFALHLH